MDIPRMTLRGALGGAAAAAMLGLAEAAWLLQTNGAPDTRSPLYAVVLYGLLGLPFGAVAGAIVGALKEKLSLNSGHASGLGVAFAVTPLGLFLLRYQVNKVVFAERGVPLTWMLGFVALFAVIGVVFAYVLPRLMGEETAEKLTNPIILANEWLTLAAVGVAALFIGGGGAVGVDQAHNKPIPADMADRPNVLVILVDTLRHDYIGAYGKRDIATPNMDALAADGILFEQAISQASWTRPSVASVFTSRIPSGHSTQVKAARLPDEVTTWAEQLGEAGVVTGGLAGNINVTETFNFNQGFDTFQYEAPTYPFWGSESVFGLTWYKVVLKLSERLLPGTRVEDYYQPAPVVFGDAKQFIEANSNSRWFLWAHTMDPHDPYFEHPSINGSGTEDWSGVGYARAGNEHPDPSDLPEMKRLYDEEVRYFDRELGVFIAWLKETGRYDNTVIVLHADHGEEFNEHDGFWHGTSLYDEAIRVPLLIKPAKGGPTGVRAPFQVNLIDVAPTVAGQLGVAPHDSWQGRDLIPVVSGWVQDEAAKARAAAEAEAAAKAALEASTNEESDAPAEAAPPAPAEEPDPCELRTHPLDQPAISEIDFEGNLVKSLRTRGYKFILAAPNSTRGLTERELFDVYNDPGETMNLAGQGSQNCGEYISDVESGLDNELAEAVKAALQGGAAVNKGCIDEAERQQLIALGYMTADEEFTPCD